MEEIKRKSKKPRQPKPMFSETPEVAVEEPEVEKTKEPVKVTHKATVTKLLNLRVGPSKNEKVITVLKVGQEVTVDEGFVSNLWSFVTADMEFGEVSGYVMTQFIK